MSIKSPVNTKDLPSHIIYLLRGIRSPSVTHLRSPVKYKSGKKWSWRPGMCTWCRTIITNSRRTSWCSEVCVDTFLELQKATWRCVERDNGICQICSTFTEKYEIDHIKPICEGGITVLDNLRLLCLPCHKQVTKELMSRRRRSIDLAP